MMKRQPGATKIPTLSMIVPFSVSISQRNNGHGSPRRSYPKPLDGITMIHTDQSLPVIM